MLYEVITIVFVSQTNYPPFEFVDPGTGARKGMMIELATWISTEFGFHADFTDAVFLEAQQDVLEGRADVLTSFFYSTERDRLFDFTDTVFDIPATIFVAADRPDITSLDDLRGKRIALPRGDYRITSYNVCYTKLLRTWMRRSILKRSTTSSCITNCRKVSYNFV